MKDLDLLRASIFVTSVSLVMLAAACSSESERPPASTSGGSGYTSASSSGGTSGSSSGDGGTSSGGDGGDDGGTLGCAASGTSSDIIQELTLLGEAPAPLGGTIVPGTYVLTELNAYGATPDAGDGGEGPSGGLSGFSARGKIVLTATGIQIVGSRGANGSALPADTATAYTFAAGGATSLDATQVCPTAGTKKALPYSAVGTGFALFPDANHRELYTKQ